MKNCKICGAPKSHYVLNNRLVCIKCDDLVFDLEIECDEDQNPKNRTGNETTQPSIVSKKNTIVVKKS